MKSLTPKQKQILEFIRLYIQENGYPPSYRDIADEFQYTSISTVAQFVKTLDRKGHLSFQSTARSIELEPVIQQIDGMIELPLVGLIAAGQPIEAIAQKETIAVPTSLVNNPNAFVLKVKGDSMIDDGILDGDYVIVERNYYPQNGDIVVALLDNTYATLKRFFRTADGVMLQPANKTMKPLYVKNPAIQGIVKGVFRRFPPYGWSSLRETGHPQGDRRHEPRTMTNNE